VSVSGFVAVKQMSEIKSGILSFLTNLLATTEELDELAETFKQINTSNDGFITKQELKIALQKSMRSSFFDCNNEDYDEILQTLSSNNED
jgi:Ca2+-binding EF-hand superfamily protein